MGQMADKIDMEMALTDPAKVFGDPMAVVHQVGLSREEKLDILRRWEIDARLMQVAAEEGMTGGESDRLRSVGLALLALGEEKGPGADEGAGNKSGS